jgi:hypothetical protein
MPCRRTWKKKRAGQDRTKRLLGEQAACLEGAGGPSTRRGIMDRRLGIPGTYQGSGERGRALARAHGGEQLRLSRPLSDRALGRGQPPLGARRAGARRPRLGIRLLERGQLLQVQRPQLSPRAHAPILAEDGGVTQAQLAAVDDVKLGRGVPRDAVPAQDGGEGAGGCGADHEAGVSEAGFRHQAEGAHRFLPGLALRVRARLPVWAQHGPGVLHLPRVGADGALAGDVGVQRQLLVRPEEPRV